MGHDVGIPDTLPAAIGNFWTAVDSNTRVRAEQIDRTDLFFGVPDQMLDLRFLADICPYGLGAGLFRNALEARPIDIGDDDAACSFVGETLGEGASDAAGVRR